MNATGTCVVEIASSDDAEPRQHVLNTGSYVLGSSARCDLRLDAAGVSRRHLELEVLPDGGVLLTDLGSRNGTLFARRQVTRQAITAPTRFRLGGARLTIHPDTEATHVLPLPSVDADAASRSASLAASKATDLPGGTGLLLQDMQVLLDDDMDPATDISRLLARWISHLDACAMRLRRKGDDAIVHAAGEWMEETDARRTVLEVGDLALDILQLQPVVAMDRTQITALRLGLAIIAARRTVPAEAPPSRPNPDAQPLRKPVHSGTSPTMRALYQLGGRVARGHVTLLVRGESGVGKELLARWIHEQSPRHDGPFLAINCAALPTDLLEAEIFGIERGVATGVEAREGLLERARGGTLFLDEVGDMAASTQAKILRALESDNVYRVGGNRPVPLDVRFIAATHQDMAQRIEDGRFRLDLFHRIAAVELTVPPLRERREDIAQLATRFLAEELAQLLRPAAGITEIALSRLCAHDWPGNVRELRNEMARAALLLDAHQPLDVPQLSPRIQAEDHCSDLSLASALADAERRAFAIAQTLCGDDHTRAMALLKLPRSSYFRHLRQLRGDNPEATGEDAT
ncbi:MAG: sigma 54-interacting transcriptional regulator [Xanthomonadales bacterium]|nr:sigma 54-interacting transcriptional regulator [Xanthomonadales bacterium]